MRSAKQGPILLLGASGVAVVALLLAWRGSSKAQHAWNPMPQTRTPTFGNDERQPTQRARGTSKIAAAPDVIVSTNVPGARVSVHIRIYGSRPDPPPLLKRCNGAGRVSLTLPQTLSPIRSITARAEADGYAPAQKVVKNGTATLRLRPAAVVSGTVLDEEQRPVGGAVVHVLGDVNEQTTDESGRFEVYTTSGKKFEIEVFHDSFINQRRIVVPPFAQLPITLERGPSVAGRVLFPSGEPVSGARVSGSGSWTVADDSGYYSLTGDPPGKILVHCEEADEARETLSGSIGVDFTVHACVARIRVEGADGRPFRGARVDASGDGLGWDATIEAGEARFDYPVGMALDVLVSAPGFRSVSLRVKPLSNPVLVERTAVLQLAVRTGSIDIHVVGSDGTHLDWATMQLRSMDRAIITKTVELDEAGHGTVTRLPEGEYVVAISPLGDSLLKSLLGRIVVRQGSKPSLRAILPVGGQLRVRVPPAYAQEEIRLRTVSHAFVPVSFQLRDVEAGTAVRTFVSESRVPYGQYTIELVTDEENVLTSAGVSVLAKQVTVMLER